MRLESGKESAAEIGRNIAYLAETGLLAGEFYAGKTCRGIFAGVNKTPEELLSGSISTISLGAFTETRADEAARYSRINDSVPHEKFKDYFTVLAAGANPPE
jgi:aspartate aminotransferase